MKFEIRRVRNGAVLRVEADGAEDGEEVVYQETESDEIEAFADFLRHLLEHYGPTTSRYSPKRICILVEPGDKYQPPKQAVGVNQKLRIAGGGRGHDGMLRPGVLGARVRRAAGCHPGAVAPLGEGGQAACGLDPRVRQGTGLVRPRLVPLAASAGGAECAIAPARIGSDRGAGSLDARSWPKMVRARLNSVDMAAIADDVRPFWERPQDAALLSRDNLLGLLRG